MLRTRDRAISKDRMTETWQSARTTLAPRLSAARDVVVPYVDEAAAKVAPAVEAARTRIVEDVLPTVSAAVENARESSAPVRAEAKERASAALLALAGKERKVRRWPFALAGIAAGALAGIAASILLRSRTT